MKSLYIDRKLRIKFAKKEGKRKIYNYLATETAKEVLIFLKRKHLTGLNFSLKDQFEIFKASLPTKLWEKLRSKASAFESKRYHDFFSKNINLYLIHNSSLQGGSKLRNSKALKFLEKKKDFRYFSKQKTVFSYMILNHLPRLFKKIEKKKTFFSSRKTPTFVRIKNRCLLHGGVRSINSELRISRQSLKKELSSGYLPSFTKASF